MVLTPTLPALRSLLLALLCLLAPAQALAQVTYPPRIGPEEFISDTADLITDADEARIRETARKLLREQGIPLVVVTINSMADYGARGWSIERYTMNLFDEWQIGHTDRNTGILLVVSKNDRKVRIEMGAAFTHSRDVIAAEIINRTIVPKFKAGQFSQGIAEGVQQIATRIGVPSAQQAPAGAGTPLQTAPPPSKGTTPTRTVSSGGILSSFGGLGCFIIPLIVVVIFMFIRKLGRRGPGTYQGGGPGYGPTGWGGGWGNRGGSGLGGTLGGLALGGLLGHMWGSRNNRSSGGSGGLFSGGNSSSGGSFGGFSGGGGGGFSGGSFGGGFSGGGGATGSW